jgi:hypothetical protein
MVPILILFLFSTGCIPNKSSDVSTHSSKWIVEFADNGRKDGVDSINGFSVPEKWGRWIDSLSASIHFREELPTHFKIIIKGGAFKSNIGKQVGIKIGDVIKQIVFSSDGFSQMPESVEVEFQLSTRAKKMEFIVPELIKVGSGDERSIAVALIQLEIDPVF